MRVGLHKNGTIIVMASDGTTLNLSFQEAEALFFLLNETLGKAREALEAKDPEPT